MMFCYFIQKKGFLNLNPNYLRDKLAWVKSEKGEGHFYDSFYRGFLVSLFHDGLNSPRHQHDFVEKYGRIPYLNGGMFSIHELEEQYPTLDIADEAFESLFAFFDQWHWHLDDRLTASGKDINPDVLGYIFEQYINDRAQMGAYYTKEDITEYIGRNTILPFLMDATQKADERPFKTNGAVWQFLKESDDTYIYDAQHDALHFGNGISNIVFNNLYIFGAGTDGQQGNYSSLPHLGAAIMIYGSIQSMNVNNITLANIACKGTQYGSETIGNYINCNGGIV